MTLRFHLFSGLAAVGLWAVASWLCLAHGSPVRELLERYDFDMAVMDFWVKVHRLPFLLGVFAGGGPHYPNPLVFYPGAVLQWFLAGFLFSLVYGRFKVRRHESG